VKVSEAAWAAGFFDGEGSVSAGTGTTGKRFISATINQIDREVSDRFHTVVGVGTVYGPYNKGPGRKRQWRWTAYVTSDVLAVYQRLKPLLGRVKIQQFKRTLKRRAAL